MNCQISYEKESREHRTSLFDIKGVADDRTQTTFLLAA